MRLTYTGDHPTDPDSKIQDWIDKLIAYRGSAGLDPLYRTLLISPSFAYGFTEFFRAIRWSSTLPEDLKELAMCRVGALNSAAFEWMHHAPLLRKAGVSQEGCETVRTAQPGKLGKDGEGGLSLKDWKVLRYVDAMTKDVKVPDEVFEEAKEAIGGDERKMLELSMSTLIQSGRSMSGLR